MGPFGAELGRRSRPAARVTPPRLSWLLRGQSLTWSPPKLAPSPLLRFRRLSYRPFRRHPLANPLYPQPQTCSPGGQF